MSQSVLASVYASNLAVLRGRVTTDPVERVLPSGGTVTQIELTTPTDGGAISVPVVLHDVTTTCATGDEVVVVGHVRRRFFRAGGVTQSRTEVVAAEVVPVTRRRSVERALARVTALLE